MTKSLMDTVQQAYHEQRAKLTRMTDEAYLEYVTKWQARAKEEAAKVGGTRWANWLAVYLAIADEALVRLQGSLVETVRTGTEDDKAWLAQQLRYFYEQREGGR